LFQFELPQKVLNRCHQNRPDTTIVTAMIGMGGSLKLRVVAEGLDTQQELDFLKAHQCEEAQGYYFSRPIPPQQFAQLLKADMAEKNLVETLS
jgi:EAL domain-containing protein (putative c-di-GMP-specific phosphodiesterase class I)